MATPPTPIIGAGGAGQDGDESGLDTALSTVSAPSPQVPQLRLIRNPFPDLAAARRDYEAAALARVYNPGNVQVERRVARALMRLADARAAVARAVG